jgi:hypothetical protein
MVFGFIMCFGFPVSNKNERIATPPFSEPVAFLYIESLKQFYHGVASGDPLLESGVIWTRVNRAALPCISLRKNCH